MSTVGAICNHLVPTNFRDFSPLLMFSAIFMIICVIRDFFRDFATFCDVLDVFGAKIAENVVLFENPANIKI